MRFKVHILIYYLTSERFSGTYYNIIYTFVFLGVLSLYRTERCTIRFLSLSSLDHSLSFSLSLCVSLFISYLPPLSSVYIICSRNHPQQLLLYTSILRVLYNFILLISLLLMILLYAFCTLYLEWSKSLLLPSNSVAKYDGNLCLLNSSKRYCASLKLDRSTTL